MCVCECICLCCARNLHCNYAIYFRYFRIRHVVYSDSVDYKMEKKCLTNKIQDKIKSDYRFDLILSQNIMVLLFCRDVVKFADDYILR